MGFKAWRVAPIVFTLFSLVSIGCGDDPADCPIAGGECQYDGDSLVSCQSNADCDEAAGHSCKLDNGESFVGGLSGTDPAGDQECEDPTAMPAAAMDVIDVDVVGEDDCVVATVTFNGDIQAFDEATEERLPFSFQFILEDGTYIEAFFEDKTRMKVSDGRAEVSYEIAGDQIILTFKRVKLEDVASIRLSTRISGYPDYSGLCDDELVVENAGGGAGTCGKSAAEIP